MDLNLKLNNKKAIKKQFSKDKNPTYGGLGTTNTTATTFARTVELKKGDFGLKSSYQNLHKTMTHTAPLKDEWDFGELEAKPGNSNDHFSGGFDIPPKPEKKKFKTTNFDKKPSISNFDNFGTMANIEEEIVGQRDVTKNINLELEAEDAEFEQLYECQQCGRSFKRNTLQKHQKICKKVFQKKKKETKVKKAPGPKAGGKAKGKGKDWKKKSEGLRNLIKNRKNGKKKEIEVEIVV